MWIDPATELEIGTLKTQMDHMDLPNLGPGVLIFPDQLVQQWPVDHCS
jgi:hypothetical protein